jgi:hypothetical protein
MPTTPQDKQRTAQESPARQQLNAVIGKHVLHTLGQPGDVHVVQVRHLWGDHYRVNVLVGVDVVSAKVAHSYFLEADDDGNIVTCVPKITRRYESAGSVSGHSRPGDHTG